MFRLVFVVREIGNTCIDGARCRQLDRISRPAQKTASDRRTYSHTLSLVRLPRVITNKIKPFYTILLLELRFALSRNREE